MIHVYKMGLSYYKNKIDKNSGMTEVKIISDELSRIRTDKNVLVIINGVRDVADECVFDEIKNYDLSIFIMSDSIALDTSLDIMNACDFVLHQAPCYTFERIKSSQFYSFVPELFYKYCKNLIANGEIKVKKTESPDVIYFGGNNKNRDDKFKIYKINEAPNIFSRYKLYETGEDTRISHIEYLKELSHYSYSLVICRKDYRNIGWITSRYFEAIALDNVPLIDWEYDINNYLIKSDVLRVKDYESLVSVHEYLRQNSLLSDFYLRNLKSCAECNTEKFKEQIERIINNK